MKQLINRLKRSKILIAATVIVTAILYLGAFVMSASSAKNEPNNKYEAQQEEEAKQIEKTSDSASEEYVINADQQNFLEILSALDTQNNFSLYCEYQDHTYHILSKDSSNLQIQYDDKLYRTSPDKILTFENNEWVPISMDDYDLYEAYTQIQDAISLLSQYMRLIDTENAYVEQKVTIDGEPFTGIVEYHDRAFRVILNGYYRNISVLVSNIGTTYFE